MALRVRNFLNTDLLAICDIWNAHHRDQLFGIPINPERMELFVQAKPYFDQAHLMIAVRDERPVGFIQICAIPDGAIENVAPSRFGIAALCTLSDEDEAEIAAMLLASAEAYCVAQGADRCWFRPALPYCSYLVGIGPADSLAGVLSTEAKLCNWLCQAGYKPAIPTTVWELDLLNFQAPADRIQMLVRRRSFVERQLQEPMLPWWQSCVLGHAEVTAFHLTDRVAMRTLQEVVMWSIAPSLRHHPESVMWLWPPSMEYSPEDAPVEIAPSDRLLFLLAESLRALQSEQVDTVRAITHAESNDLHRVLNRLGFKAAESGVVFERIF